MTDQEYYDFLRNKIRRDKNSLLAMSDWVAIPDSEVEESLKAEIIAWRSALRSADDNAQNLNIEQAKAINYERHPSVFSLCPLSKEACAILKVIPSMYE